MTWFAFQGYQTVNVAGVQEKTLVVWGFHGYATKAQADAHPNSVAFWQKPEVNLIIADYNQAVKTGEQPGGPNSNLAKPSSAIGSLKMGIQNELFHGLNLSNWLLRVGEIVLGIVLIGVGLAHVTGQENMISGALKTAAVGAVIPK